MKISKINRQKGIIALIFLSFVFAAMGLFVRYLSINFTLLQQVYLRVFAAFIIGFVFFYKDLHFEKLKLISPKEWFLLLFRSFSWYGMGVTLFSLGVLKTKYSNVSFISALPLTALFGFLLLQEKVTLKKILFIILAFIGVLLIAVKDYFHIFDWGTGEVMALVSTVFFSLAYVTRKYHSNLLSNKEISVLLFFLAFVILFFSSLIVDKSLPLSNWHIGLVLIILLAGVFNATNIFLTNYGFQNVEVTLASNLLTLESAFAIVLGLLFYHEIPSLKELMGGGIIVASVIGMNYVANQKK